MDFKIYRKGTKEAEHVIWFFQKILSLSFCMKYREANKLLIVVMVNIIFHYAVVCLL